MRKLSTNEWIAVVVAIIVVGFAIFFGSGFTFFSSGTTNDFMTDTNQQNETNKEYLKITDTQVGDGQAVKAGDTVTVNYRGLLVNGSEFDSSYRRNAPFSFTVGNGSVIRGWELGIPGMKVGGKRTLEIAPEYGYGDRVAGPIPPNSTLIFEVELLSIN